MRWLLANKRFDQAERVIRRAARISGVSAHKVMQVFKDKIQSPLVPMTPSAGSENPRQQLEGGDDIGNEHVTQVNLLQNGSEEYLEEKLESFKEQS